MSQAIGSSVKSVAKSHRSMLVLVEQGLLASQVEVVRSPVILGVEGKESVSEIFVFLGESAYFSANFFKHNQLFTTLTSYLLVFYLQDFVFVAQLGLQSHVLTLKYLSRAIFLGLSSEILVVFLKLCNGAVKTLHLVF